jgi:hypothetical protein
MKGHLVRNFLETSGNRWLELSQLCLANASNLDGNRLKRLSDCLRRFGGKNALCNGKTISVNESLSDKVACAARCCGQILNACVHFRAKQPAQLYLKFEHRQG